MKTFLIIVAILAVFILIGGILGGGEPDKKPKKKLKIPNKYSPGMYFMEMYEVAKQQSTTLTGYCCYRYATNWYRLLALACQGRIPELDDMYDYVCSSGEWAEEYINLLKIEKKQIYAMARIAKRIDDAPIKSIGYETIGEYTDKKLLKNKSFMEKYSYYTKLNFEQYYRDYIQKKEDATPERGVKQP